MSYTIEEQKTTMIPFTKFYEVRHESDYTFVAFFAARKEANVCLDDYQTMFNEPCRLNYTFINDRPQSLYDERMHDIA